MKNWKDSYRGVVHLGTFGGGGEYTLCGFAYDKRAAEVAAHNNAVEERAMAELADAQSVRKWSLSDRERELQKYIGSKR